MAGEWLNMTVLSHYMIFPFTEPIPPEAPCQRLEFSRGRRGWVCCDLPAVLHKVKILYNLTLLL